MLLELHITRFGSPYSAFAKLVAFMEEINVYTVWTENWKKNCL
jgi:hypothetical protein